MDEGRKERPVHLSSSNTRTAERSKSEREWYGRESDRCGQGLERDCLSSAGFGTRLNATFFRGIDWLSRFVASGSQSPLAWLLQPSVPPDTPIVQVCFPS
jgi:hypothetical protein